MNETSKTIPLLKRSGLLDRMTGLGIDIGSGYDAIKVPGSIVTPWDRLLGHGDAFTLPGVPDDHFDWVFSSHCLEDSTDVPAALGRWSQVLKPGGLMIILVPSYKLYEHYVWPSKGNSAHRASFDLFDDWVHDDHPHYTLSDMIRIGELANLKLEGASVQCEGYDFSRINDKTFDQTRHGALAQCMFVFVKR
jgi:SAM-dependent methyltransferase